MAKGAYVGVAHEIPIYSYETTVWINGSNIDNYFTVTHGTYGFYDSDNIGGFITNNTAIRNSTAKTTLTALSSGDISFSYSYSSEPNYDKFTLTVAGTVIENAVSGATTTKNYSGSIEAGQTIVFQYTKDSSTNSNDDECVFYDMAINVKTLTGTEIRSIAHKIRKGYIGVDGAARKIKKAYIGIGGVARPCWSHMPELAYYGTITDLSQAREDLVAIANNEYVIIAGGNLGNTTVCSTVDAYSRALTHITPDALSVGRCNIGAATVGELALLAGGSNRGETDGYTVSVDGYDSSLTKVSATELPYSCWGTSGASIGQYAIFAGGRQKYSTLNTIVAYDDQLTQSISASKLSSSRANAASATISGKVIFLGGQSTYLNSSASSALDAYDSSLTSFYQTTINASLTRVQAATVGEYALFAGGINSNSQYVNSVYAYDASLTLLSGIVLSEKKGYHAATSMSDCAVFGGGMASPGASASAVVDLFNEELTLFNTTNMSNGKRSHCATTLGGYALFAGGFGKTSPSTSSVLSSVEVYTGT